jgi:tRNA (guanine9-N1)-methyltransferase
MEAEERPKKIRKLGHSALNEEHALAEQDVSNEVPPLQMTVDAGEKADHLKSTAADATEINELNANDTDISASEDHAEPETPGGQSTSALPLSKNALKKIRNKEKWDAGRDARKLKRKQKIAEKRIRKRAAKEEAQAAAAKAAEEESNRKGKKTIILQDTPLVRGILIEAIDLVDKASRTMHTRLPITFVIDCGFDNLMTEKEMISLGSQLTRSYSDNHKAPYQAHMFVSSWGGQLKERFNIVLEKHHENWRGVTFVEEDFVAAAERAKELMKGKTGGKLAGALSVARGSERGIGDHFEALADEVVTEEVVINEDNSASGEPHLALESSDKEGHMIAQKPSIMKDVSDKPKRGNAGTALDGHTQGPGDAVAEELGIASGLEAGKEGEVVYLTSDSPHTLDRLQPYSTYIIGGLVDKNRHKGICYKTACDRGIKTAKLPIGEFMEMQSRFVLATNHVVEIMVRWLECGDWGESFVKVMPKRKGGVLKAAYGTKHDVHGPELEAEDSTPASGDSGEAKAGHLQGGDVLENGQNVPSMSTIS